MIALVIAMVGMQAASPYAGQEGRPLKALSPEDVTAYLEGQGHGFAKAAELNHYPGPKHVLELAGPLGLSDAQRARVKASFDSMHAEAVRLGREVIAAEKALDALFASGTAAPETLRAAVAQAARLNGELRATHLLAHLETKAVLTPEQVVQYDRLRGYGSEDAPGHQHRHH
jgi:Spy/CpxP family protein refolding chaperone